MTRKAKPVVKKSVPQRGVTAYTVVRSLPAESPIHSTPERVFATKAAAQRFADERNRELRAVTNPFGEYDGPETYIKGGQKAFRAVLKKLDVAAPPVTKAHEHIDWAAWWDRSYFDVTDAQRDALWDALDKFDWYEVQATTVE